MTDSDFLLDGLSLVQKGGPVMFILLGLSIIGLGIIFAKVYQFARSRIRSTGFITQAVNALSHGDVRAAKGALSQTPHPVARVMEVAINTAGDNRLSTADRDAEISRVGSAEIRNLESYLRGLEVIANLSPLLGLLGTVLGMIQAFADLEGAGTKVDPAILAGGIWEALLTTAFGLCVALPALAAFYWLEGRVDDVRAAMKDAVSQILNIYGHGPRQAAA